MYQRKYIQTEWQEKFNDIDFENFLSDFMKICHDMHHLPKEGKMVEWSNHIIEGGVLYLGMTARISSTGILVELRSQPMYLLEFWFHVAYGSSFREIPDQLYGYCAKNAVDIDELFKVALKTDADTASNKDNHIKVTFTL